MGKARRYEYLFCPGCGRTIGAYVPKGGDGVALRVVVHSRPAAVKGESGGLCEISDHLVIFEHGKWRRVWPE